METLLISLLIGCLILGVVWWIISLIPLPPPFGQVVQVVVVVIALLWLILLLTGLPGLGFHHRW